MSLNLELEKSPQPLKPAVLLLAWSLLLLLLLLPLWMNGGTQVNSQIKTFCFCIIAGLVVVIWVPDLGCNKKSTELIVQCQIIIPNYIYSSNMIWNQSLYLKIYVYKNTYIKQYQFLKSGHKVDRELGWVYERIWGEEREGGKFIIKI